MSGLSAEKVADLILKLKLAVVDAKQSHAFDVAEELSDVVRVIERLQKESSDQTSRPDRIGDECWYEFVSYDYVNDNVVRVPTWKRGVLRCWYCSNENCIAMVEDSESHGIVATGNLSFSTEAPT